MEQRLAQRSRCTVVDNPAITLSYNARMRGWLAVIALCGCRQILGVDTPVHEQGDAATADVPQSLTLTGLIFNGTGSAAVANAKVTWETDPNATVAASNVTGSDGKYTLVLPYHGVPLDGYVHVSQASYVETYFYPAKRPEADGRADIALASQNTVSLLCSACQVACDSMSGLIGLSVVDAAGAALAGVTVSTAPAGTVCYDSGGFPSPAGTATANDGAAFVLNVPAGSVTVDATQAGKTFQQHAVIARAGVFTITNIFEGP